MAAAAHTSWLGAGGFTVLGVLIGVAGTLVNEWNKARREDSRQWHLEVRAAAAEYMRVLQSLMPNPFKPQRDSFEEVLGTIDEAAKAKAALIFIAPPSILDAANTYWVAVMNAAPDLFKLPMDEAIDVSTNVTLLRLAFINAVRKYLRQSSLTSEFFA